MLGLLIASCVLIFVIYWWYENVYKPDKYLERYPGPKKLPILGNALQIGNSISMLGLLIAGCVLIFTIYWWYENVYKPDKCLERYPGPKRLPILGNALQIGNSITMLQNLLKFQYQYGGIYTMKIGPVQTNLVVTDYKVVEFLLKSNTLLTKGSMYKFFVNWLGAGLIFSTGDKWRKHRQLLTPGFHLQILEQFIPIFDSTTNILIQKLNNLIDQSSINIPDLIHLCTLDIICESAMNVKLNAQLNPTLNYSNYLHELCRISIRRSFSAVLMFDLFYRFTEDYHKEKIMKTFVQEKSMSVLRERKRTFDINQMNGDDGKKKRFTFLDILLQAHADGEPLSDEDIRENVDNFMFAGHDTTASMMTYLLYSLSKNIKIQDKIIDELRIIFGNDVDRPPTLQDLNDMKYLEMVVKESLRLHPPAPIISRELEEDVEYDGGILPKGLTLLVFIFGIHRNPEYFPDPEKFDPERFAPENCNGRNPFSYIPFSAGPRNCIGHKFAMLEVKAIISKLLRHFEVLPTNPEHNVVLKNDGLLKSANGVLIRLKKRNFDEM